MENSKKLRLLAEYLAQYIESHHPGYVLPSKKELANYIENGFKWYEVEHIDQEIKILES